MDVCRDYAKSYKLIPSFIINYSLKNIQKRIKALAGFDITDVDSIEAAKWCSMPALFIHSINDTLVLPEHANELF